MLSEINGSFMEVCRGGTCWSNEKQVQRIFHQSIHIPTYSLGVLTAPEGHIRDPTGSQCTVRNWKLVVRDVNWKPPQPTEARKQLNNAVVANYNDKTIYVEIGAEKFEIPQSTPWFDAWREAYFEVQFPSDHEFTKHFVGCIMVATTSDENVMDTFNSLLQKLTVLQNITPPKLPKWFSSNILKTYVLLHDTSVESKDKADSLFEQAKQIYGVNNCFLLSINSKSIGEPDGEHVMLDPWAPYISHTPDVNNEPVSGPNSLPRTPVDPRTVSSPSTNITAVQEDNTIVVQPEGLHPLSPIEDTETYDNANSLQMLTEFGKTLQVDDLTVLKRLKVIGMIQKQGHWVPYKLKPRDVERRFLMCELLHQRQKRKGFLHRIVTGDEKWIPYDNPKHRKSWGKPGHASTLSAKPWFQALLIQPNTEKYLVGSRHDKVILLHDNARPHVAKPVKTYLEMLQWEVLPHPLYSPDIDPSDFHLFRLTAHGLADQYFHSCEEAKKWIHSWIASKDVSFFRRGIHILLERWKKVVASDEQYFE
ncbi:Mariner Mos1 transposase [Eumeta japonica]|uniref:Mariner Mos1 transposase n=1 Tax=Eumeta variegata TaxID=151549 RepID=A0A4C1W5C4_EUMVA|nr:Mariner Mos1 transposase [Eumeta japonica]